MSTTTCARVATSLDQRMLERDEAVVKRGAAIAIASLEVRNLPTRSGVDVAEELNGRPLIRYMAQWQAEAFSGAEEGKEVFTSPTPLNAEDGPLWLALPAAWTPRAYVVYLDPAKIDLIQGPHWVDGGLGIEYLLPDGYSAAATIIKLPIRLS